uniref:Fibronectin type-III domain-containing protein n=2 Tax=Eptatretus burgeri TaxID=7764 RepID=A0A8C4QMF8_EPTBU
MYKLEYNKLDLQDVVSIVIRKDSSKLIITNLEPATTYIAHLTYTNSTSVIDKTDGAIFTTHDPWKVLDVVVILSSKEITWNPSSYPSDPVVSYTANVEPVTPSPSISGQEIDTTSPFCMYRELKAGINYSVQVTAVTQSGYSYQSDPVFFTSYYDIMVNATPSNTSAVITWENLNSERVVNKWMVKYRNPNTHEDVVTNASSSLTTTLEDLLPNTTIPVTVFALTDDGQVDTFRTIMVTTLPSSKASRPLNLRFQEGDFDSLFVVWDKPKITTGNVKYMVSYSNVNEITTNIFLFVTGLEQDMEYTFRVVAIDDNGNGSATSKAYHKPATSRTGDPSKGTRLIPFPAQHVIEAVRKSAILLELPQCGYFNNMSDMISNGKDKMSVCVIVVEDGDAVEEGVKLPNSILNNTYGSTNVGKNEPYTAGCMSLDDCRGNVSRATIHQKRDVASSTGVYNVGSEDDIPSSESTASHYNGPLKEATDYRVRYILNDESSIISFSNWSNVIQTKKGIPYESINTSSMWKSAAMIIAATILAILLALLLLLLCLTCLCCKRRTSNTLKARYTIYNTHFMPNDNDLSSISTENDVAMMKDGTMKTAPPYTAFSTLKSIPEEEQDETTTGYKRLSSLLRFSSVPRSSVKTKVYGNTTNSSEHETTHTLTNNQRIIYSPLQRPGVQTVIENPAFKLEEDMPRTTWNNISDYSSHQSDTTNSSLENVDLYNKVIRTSRKSVDDSFVNYSMGRSKTSYPDFSMRSASVYGAQLHTLNREYTLHRVQSKVNKKMQEFTSTNDDPYL